MAKFSRMANRGRPWKLQSRIVEMRDEWMALVGERWSDEEANQVDYWRVENPDSLIVIVIADSRLLLPPPSFRPGVGRSTLDFCGGRLRNPEDLRGEAERIVRKELGLGEPGLFDGFERVNPVGWETNSSFESQRVFGVVGVLRGDLVVDADRVGSSFYCNEAGIADLREQMTCLQCRGVLGEALRLGLLGGV